MRRGRFYSIFQLAFKLTVAPVYTVEKAFAFGLDASSKGYDLGTDLVLSASRIGLIAAVVSKIQDDPACAKLVYSLYAGPKFAPLGTTPLGAYQDRDVPFDDAAPVPFADIERIQNIAIYSGYDLPRCLGRGACSVD